MSLIEIHALKKNYGNFQALKGLDLNFEAGRIVGLLGPNGSGKTTLLRILSAYDMNYQGEVRIDGQAPGLHSRAITSSLPDKANLSLSWTPQKAIAVYQDFFADFNADKAQRMLEDLKMDRRQKLEAMSKGMQEKIQVVMTMSRDAQIYLLDEPISGVDPAARKVILQMILENYCPESLMILSTHMIRDIEPIIDDALFLKEGELVLHDQADAIRAREGKSIHELFEEVFQ